MEQIELNYGSSGPVVSQAEVDSLCSFLAERGWVKAQQIETETNLNERKIRAIAEASDGRIISGPGCPGYKLFTGAAELREVDEAASRLESQAHRMIKRAITLRRRAHRFIS